eukprot:CAMPEP_0204565134 /NCGR_PEP_ID=MMETSP0661-20131031/35296_1 /ASSEMBLY_ACC=CAM_ASM_000606 /TAXON_ID=109239 /ORGANISM="Alexandrium margalefi, Strain AMGDE01CS-322" /LENGTH=86 /DNA_ID=CAMNT_0051572851 /DNA_START=180 /DNA_END=437 /DNA_ORIENTATION=-
MTMNQCQALGEIMASLRRRPAREAGARTCTPTSTEACTQTSTRTQTRTQARKHASTIALTLPQKLASTARADLTSSWGGPQRGMRP